MGPFRGLRVVPVCVALAGLGALLLALYYNDRYGRVTLKARAHMLAGTVGGIAAMIAVPTLVQVLDLPVNGFGLAWGAVALTYYALTVGLRPHHVAIWGAVVAASLVPLWDDPRTTNSLNVGLILVGVAAMATGIFDHRLLVRTFGPPSGSVDVGHSNAGA